jgi:peptide-methionine (R)-S-oxide reductase
MMNHKRRKFLEFFSFSYLSIFLLPYNMAYAVTKKIINPNLTNEQKKIMLNESTERPFSSPLNKEKRKGFFHCANCGAKLFTSNAKFDSGTGWPSFTESIPGAFKTKIDYSFGMKRVEYHCAKCGVHHGHIFDDGSTSTQKRFCSNGLCLIFKPSS